MKTAPLAQVVDHVGVVDDFVAHVDRRAKLLQGALDDLDGAVDAGAETARLGQQEFFAHAFLTAPRSVALQTSRLAGQRVVEVEQAHIVAQLAQDAGKAAAARGEIDQVADLVVGIRQDFRPAWRG
jgi:hypothetical protein